MGEFNARVGRSGTYRKAYLGRMERGKTNSNALQLLEKYTERNLAIINAYFKMPDT